MKNLLMKQSYVILILFAFIASASQLSAQNTPLHYGDVIYLQNGWNNYDGGYLDTRGYQKDYETTGNFLCVSTATVPNRGDGSGSWKVMSATGKADGSPVLVNDDVYLFNIWNKNGGYLDTRGYQKDYEKTGNHLCVSTATVSNRADGSGTWKIISATGSPAGTAVTTNSEIRLQNGWNKFNGGYLDTRGYQKDYEKTGNHLCVSTATSADRADGSGTWKITIVRNTLKTGEVLNPGDKLVSANNAFMLIMQTDGNFCVYKYENGKQGGFVWCSMKYGFANGKLIMQTDGNLCVYDGANGFKWGSYQAKAYALGGNYKLVLTDAGKLNIMNASGTVLWTN